MSNSLTLGPSPHPNAEQANVRPRRGIGAMFMAALEALVKAQRGRFEDGDPLLYRFPPI